MYSLTVECVLLLTTNMHVFDANLWMKRFATPEAILEHFFRHRLLAYHRRKAYQVARVCVCVCV